MHTRSQQLFSAAQTVIPGGVNSPVRAFKSVGDVPRFFKQGFGPYLIDEDNQQYIDYVGSWGPLILGHAHPKVIARIQEVLSNGLSFGAPTEIELLLAQKILKLMPQLQLVRMVSSGTEATMTALRLARAYTKRELVIKFDGCYHGHSDSLLIKMGSGGLTFGEPNSPGVPKALAALTLSLPYNDTNALEQTFQQLGEQIAGVIVEPIVGNMGCVLPTAAFLAALRKQCDLYGSVLIIDEVMTGFRVALGGAQALLDLQPDLSTLGKIIGGGMPVAAVGGKMEIMQLLAPLGPVYQAGTLSGNPIAMHAGLATLEQLEAPGFHEQLQKNTDLLVSGLKQIAAHYNVPVQIPSVTGMFSLFFTEQSAIENLAQVLQCDVELFKQFFHGMLTEGVYLAPSAFEAGFVSIMHDALVIEKTLEAAKKVFAKL